MRKSKILKACKSYSDYFKKHNHISRIKYLEYHDFVSLHIHSNSQLVSELEQMIKTEMYIQHANSVSKFISDNDSKMNYAKPNFLYQFNDTRILTALLFLFSTIFSVGFYFGSNEKYLQIDAINEKLENLNNLIIQSIIPADTIPYNKTHKSRHNH